jgi:hypothetical protein
MKPFITWVSFNDHSALKGTVQWHGRGVKIGINRSILRYSLASKCPSPCLNGHHHKRSINIFSGFSTFDAIPTGQVSNIS